MAKRADRTRWVSYLGVSTVEQAEKEMSQTAQRRAEEEFAARHDAVIDHHYVEPGASGTDMHRIVWNELLGDALRPGSTTAVIVVHHTSRFTLDATHARVVKKELRRAGVRVLSVTQELTEDPMGSLMQSFFECIDQYQSEVNRQRTAATEGIRSSKKYTPSVRPWSRSFWWAGVGWLGDLDRRSVGLAWTCRVVGFLRLLLLHLQRRVIDS